MKLKEIQEERFSLRFDSDTQLIDLYGPIEIGLLSSFEKMLSKHPQSSGVVLSSTGGNIYQARGLAKLIMTHSLDTYIIDICHSDCAIAYLAGTQRYIGTNGKLGFLQYDVNLNFMNPVLDIEKEQKKDLNYFSARIPDSDSVEQIFDSECTDYGSRI